MRYEHISTQSVALINMESYHKGNACYVDEKYERAAEVEEDSAEHTKLIISSTRVIPFSITLYVWHVKLHHRITNERPRARN